jgi:S-adenosylmethionine:tRNA ribosyltransferase-isomerase
MFYLKNRMLLSEFHYELPPELIAQEPLADRSASRMLVVDREKGALEDRVFHDLPEYLRTGDCLVVNDSKVFPARLFGDRDGYKVEVFLIEPVTPDRLTWKVLVKPGKRAHPGHRIVFDDSLAGVVTDRMDRGQRLIRFDALEPFDAVVDRIGHVPLPPYVKREDSQGDRERYQTVYAAQRGSVAAPTAGLHFTPEVLDACKRGGADIARVTLHVGLGTFQPLSTDIVEEAQLHAETYQVTAPEAQRIRVAKRVICVGTTSTRTVETAHAANGLTDASTGSTDLFIYPGYRFQRVGGILTNFHLPSTSLLLLVAAFAGKGLTMAAYRHAVERRYRFYSYGDCMLIL